VIFSAELLVQTVLSGLMVGVLYALMALGITFIYSIVKTINWAMGEFYMIGSYLQYMLVAFLLGPDLWWVAVLVSAAGVFVMGLVGWVTGVETIGISFRASWLPASRAARCAADRRPRSHRRPTRRSRNGCAASGPNSSRDRSTGTSPVPTHPPPECRADSSGS